MSSVPNAAAGDGISRKDRRKKWMQQRQKGKREGLREKAVVSYNDVKIQTPVLTIKNKGGFRTSELTQKLVVQKTTESRREQFKSNNKNSKINNNKTTANKVNNKSANITKNDNKKKTKTMTEANPIVSNVNASPSKLVPQKYILFVGNLPSDVSKEQLEEHFRKTGGVKTIRIPKEKGTDKSRGFAYIEFKDRISHGIALRLHHTTMNGKKINVEFTSPGSGKSETRKEKLKQKNNALVKHKIPYRSSS